MASNNHITLASITISGPYDQLLCENGSRKCHFLGLVDGLSTVSIDFYTVFEGSDTAT